MTSTYYNEDFLPVPVASPPPNGRDDEETLFNGEEAQERPEYTIRDVMTTPTSTIESLDEARLQINALKEHVHKMNDFINAKHLLLEAPPEVQDGIYMRSDGAEQLAEAILNKARVAAIAVCALPEDHEVSSDNFSKAMIEPLALVYGLCRLRHAGVHALAYQCVVEIQELSLGTVDRPVTMGSRPSDKIADELLSRIAFRRIKMNAEWDFGAELDRMRVKRDELKSCGIVGWCPLTIRMMEALASRAQ